MKYALLFLLALFTSLVSAQTLNPAVTQATIKSTICAPGWTATIRPSVAYTNKIKKAMMVHQGISWDKHASYVLDHSEALELGGAPKDRANFLLQTSADSTAKNLFENKYHKLVCAGKLTLAQGQACFMKDWHTCQ
jgi:hypothetical protein